MPSSMDWLKRYLILVLLYLGSGIYVLGSMLTALGAATAAQHIALGITRLPCDAVGTAKEAPRAVGPARCISIWPYTTACGVEKAAY